jgi:NADPH-dependent curcumin reductase CurA
MKAFIAHTSEGRTKVLLEEVSEKIELYFENLGGKKFEEFWIFSREDARYVPETLADEGYTVTTSQLL